MSMLLAIPPIWNPAGQGKHGLFNTQQGMKRNTLYRESQTTKRQQQEDCTNIHVLAGSYQAARGLMEQNGAAEKMNARKTNS